MEKKEGYKELFKKHKCCVLIPTYNNSATLTKLISEVMEFTLDIIVVNDGSTDNTEFLLKEIAQIEVVSYPKNKGKGFALRTGIDHALKQGFENSISIDSDGQHFASDLPVFIKALEDNANSLIIGARSLKGKAQPNGSSFANKFSNFWFKIETGITLADTQSGYRLYPIKEMSGMKWYSNKFEFEIEVIVRSAWKGINVFCVPIEVYYPKKEERITHFRPFMDFFRISVLNTILVTLALLYYLPMRFLRKYKNRKLKDIIREDIISADTPNIVVAISIGFGVFMGILPIWGYQLVVGFLIVHLLRLNKAIFFIAANISLPAMIPFILYLSYVTGSYVMGDGNWNFDMDITWQTIKDDLVQYIIGAVVLAVISGIFFGVISYFALIVIKAIRK